MEAIPQNFPAEVYLFKGTDSLRATENIICDGHILFIFVKAGIVKASIDGSRISCTSSELLITICRKYCEVIKCSKNTTCYLVKVQWQFITDIKMSSKFIDIVVSRHILKTLPDSFDSKVINRIMKLLHYYYQCRHNPKRYPLSSCNAALSLLVFQAAWQQDNQFAGKGVGHTRKELLAIQFLKLLVQHYKVEHSIVFYAQRLCVSSGYLNKAVREVTGRTVSKCIAEIIISEAKYLLLSTDLTIETISEELCFHSAGSFSRFFKKEAAVSPTEYRKTTD